MSFCSQRNEIVALIAVAAFLFAAGCGAMKPGSVPASGDAAGSALGTQPVVWEVIDGGMRGGNLLTGLEYVRLVRPVAVAARGPAVYIVDEGLEQVLLYRRDRGELRILQDLRRLVSGTVSDIYVASDLSYYLADFDGGRVLYFDRDDRLIRVYEDRINLGRPVAVVVDEATSTLYIADGFNDDVLVYNRAGLLSGAIGERGEGPGRFRGVTAFALGPEGYYVATRYGESRVQVIAPDGGPLASFEKDTVIFPTSIVVDARGWAYVGDYLTDTIRVFEGTHYRFSVGRSGTAPGQFKRVADLWLEGGLLYVADAMNGRIQVLEATRQNLERAETPRVQ